MFTVAERAAPDTPSTGLVHMYAKTDGLWYSKDDAGVENLVTFGGGGTLTGALILVNDAFGALQAVPLRDIAQYIQGLTYNNGTDATNDIDILAGVAVNSTNAYLLRLASTLVKQLDAAWAVGTNAGGLDTGAIGNSDYYIHLIARSDTGVVDALFSLSATAPTMPTSYDFRRLIGWFKRVAGTIVAFTTYEIEGGGIELAWNAPTLDVSLANTLTTSRRTDAVKVPLDFSVIAMLYVAAYDAASQGYTRVNCPDQTDVAASGSEANANNIATGVESTYELHIRTSATGLIAARSNLATVDNYYVRTVGFQWARR